MKKKQVQEDTKIGDDSLTVARTEKRERIVTRQDQETVFFCTVLFPGEKTWFRQTGDFGAVQRDFFGT